MMQPVSDVDLGTRWLERSPDVVRHYVCTWFVLDLASILVSVFDIIPVLSGSSGEAMAADDLNSTLTGDGGDLSALQSLMPLRLLRALRLIKLLRLSKVARIMKRWETELAINYATSTRLPLRSVLTPAQSSHTVAAKGLIAISRRAFARRSRSAQVLCACGAFGALGGVQLGLARRAALRREPRRHVAAPPRVLRTRRQR